MTATETHAHDHPDFLQHHWDTPVQQFEAGKMGMWLFLATEVLLFGGLFVAYAVWRGNHPDMFRFGSRYLNTTMGAINTAVLIASSLTMAAAVTMAQRNKRGALIILLSLTLAGAITFLVIKYFEYTHKFREGWYPGVMLYERPAHAESWIDDYPTPRLAGEGSSPVVPAAFAGGPVAEPTTVPPPAVAPAGVDAAALAEMDGIAADHDEHGRTHLLHPAQDPDRPANAHMFFNIYFMMTGLHGIHVTAGVFMLSWLIWGAARGRFTSAYFTPVDLGGLYWHIVDLIWIFLFPLFYLI